MTIKFVQENAVDVNTVQIGIAKTDEERKSVFQLRYKIYAEEVGFKLVNVDHGNKLLYDDLDRWGLLFYAKHGNEYVGTVRINIGRQENFPLRVQDTFYMSRFRKFYENGNYNFAFESKGMVLAEYRKMPIFTMLMSRIFEVLCDKDIQFSFGNSNFHLLPLHEYYGHRQIGKNIVDPDLGLMTSFVIMPDDIEHLTKVKSPFLRIAQAYNKKHNSRLVEWFRSEFPVASKYVNSQLVNEDAIWAVLSQFFGKSPLYTLSILKGLTEIEAKKFIHTCGVIIHCPKDDFITTKEDVSQEMIILLSGEITADNCANYKSVAPGQHFGSNGLVKRLKHETNIRAKTDVVILILSYHFFLKFTQSYPIIALKIINNLTAMANI